MIDLPTDETVSRLEAAIAELSATARKLDPDPEAPDRPPDEPTEEPSAEPDRFEAIEARLVSGNGPTPVEEDPIRAGLETLLELSERRPTPEGGADPFEGASASVGQVQDQVRTLADLFSAYGRDTARPEVAAQMEPMTTPAEPQEETVVEETVPPHRATKRRLARLAVVLVASAVLSPVVTGVAPVSFYAVATGSMTPEIPQGSLVWTETADPAVGDVVVYESHLGKPTVHRVTDVRTIDGATYYRTQGDANPSADAFSVPKERVHGVVAGSVPMVGNLWMIDLHVQAAAFAGLVGGYVALTLAFDEDLLARIRRIASDEADADRETPAPAV